MARRRRHPSSPPVDAWELVCAKRVALEIRTPDRDELEAVLAIHVLQVKAHRPHARHWKAYLTQALRNKAKNWIRDRQRSERATTSIETPLAANDELTRADFLIAPEAGLDLQTAFATAWDELGHDLQELWRVLAQEGGNQVRAATRLRKHRNTVRAWVGRIEAVLRRHGFGNRR